MMNRVNGSGNFYNTMQDLQNANPEYAKTAISKLMSTPFAYETLEKMLQGQSSTSTTSKNSKMLS